MKQRNLNRVHTTMQILEKTNVVPCLVLLMFGKHISVIYSTECYLGTWMEWIT